MPESEDRPEVFSAYAASDEERRAALEKFTEALATAGPDFGAATRSLQEAASGVPTIEVMGVIAMYLGSAEAGSNPEHNRPLDVYQHHIELVQALLLRFGAGDGSPPFWRHVPPLVEAVQRYNEAWIVLQGQKVERASPGPPKDLERTLMQLRLHASTRRGWGYESRMIPMLINLLDPLAANARPRVGVAPASLVRWWAAMAERVNQRLDDHRAAVRDALSWDVDDTWTDRLAERFGRLDEPRPGAWAAGAADDHDLRHFYVTQCSDIRAHELYRFTLDDLVELMPEDVDADTVRRIMSKWSFKLGEDSGVRMPNLPLENPILARPFIQAADDAWYLFCGWLFLHNPFELIERVFDGHDDLFAEYMERRAEFLESEVARLLEHGLPGAHVERSLLSVDPSDTKEYENDVVALISTFAVVAEAKAGRLHPEARRGRSRVLRDRLEELMVKSSRQGTRLAGYLERETGQINFTRKADGSHFPLEGAGVRRALAISVTLEPIADLLPRLHEVVESGLTGPEAAALAYTISLPDLELIVDLLDHPSEVLHYLYRRTEIEQHTFLMGDEVDLLALYLQTGFNIGEREFSGRDILDVTGLSDPIDVWHYSREAGIPADKPRSERTRWWEAVISRVEERGGPRWAEIGFTMCNLAPPEQDEFEQALKTLRQDIANGTRAPTDVVVFDNGPPQRRDVFVGLVANSPDASEREKQYQAAAANVASNLDLPRIVMLAWTPKPIDLPYFALLLYEAT